LNELNASKKDEEIVEKKPRRRVLELRNVTFGHRPEDSLCLYNESMTVHRGDLVMIRSNASQSTRRFASMLQGLETPKRGTVLFNGRDWATQHARTQFAMRSKIGRVFDRQGWVANLNVRENLLLAKQHFDADLEAIEKELVFWADWFQLGNISRMRPALVEGSRLQIHQWIRAYLGKPALLVLERPMRSVSLKVFGNFLASVRHMQQRGTAVIWIAGSTLGDDVNLVSPDAVLDMRRDTEDADASMAVPQEEAGALPEDSSSGQDDGGRQ
jgi:ABC-type ATPase involved in cell division